MMKTPIKFWQFLLSLTGHLVLLCGLLYIGQQDVINKKFLVLGAHSQKTYETLFKTFKTPRAQTTRRRAPKKNTKKITSKKKEIKKKISKVLKKKAIKKQTIPAPRKNKKILNIPKKVIKSVKKKRPKPIKKNDAVLKQKTPVQQKHADLRFNLTGSTNKVIREYQEHIQKEIVRLWQPPIGAPKGTECSVKFVISKLGKVERFKMLKRSQMLIYDLSILRVAKRFKFHASLWDKKFIIDFRQ